MNNELKPCPFCGGNRIAYSMKTATSNYERIYRTAMYCEDCNAYGGRVIVHPTHSDRYDIERFDANKQAAIDAWNRRATDE